MWIDKHSLILKDKAVCSFTAVRGLMSGIYLEVVKCEMIRQPIQNLFGVLLTLIIQLTYFKLKFCFPFAFSTVELSLSFLNQLIIQISIPISQLA